MEKRRTIEVTRKVVIEQSDISNLLATALYGGITDWCPKFKANGKLADDDRDYEDKVAEHLFKGGTVTFYEEDEEEIEENFPEHTVSLDDFVKGIGLYLRDGGNPSCLVEESRGGKEQVTAIEWGDIDAIEADAMIQYICFGEVIYG